MKVMVFWLAKLEVMSKLLDECAAAKEEVYCLIQSNDHASYAHLYPEVRFTVVEGGWSQYKESGTDSHLREKVLDVVYIPSSSPYFYSFETIFPIVNGLRYRCVTLYDCYGKKRVFHRGSAWQEYVRYALTRICSKGFGVMYQLKCLVSWR